VHSFVNKKLWLGTDVYTYMPINCSCVILYLFSTTANKYTIDIITVHITTVCLCNLNSYMFWHFHVIIREFTINCDIYFCNIIVHLLVMIEKTLKDAWYTYWTVAYPGILFGGGVWTNSVEDRGQKEWESGGGSPLIRGSGGSCNLVQEISFHAVNFS
jgi:hypothetical protein